jgi:CP family cyanate transporter-like MFS transporter
VILVLLVVLTAGSVLRGQGTFFALMAGMVLAGLGIGVVQVLLPGIMKRDFPGHAGAMTGLYTMNLCLGAAAGTGMAYPLRQALGSWELSLMAWGLPVAAAALLWAPQAFAPQSPPPRIAHPSRLWRDPLAWSVTCFMGLQSCLAYVTIARLPLILEQRGADGGRAGFIAALAIAAQTVTALMVPPVAARFGDQRAVSAVSVLAAVVGFLGLVFGPSTLAIGFAVIMGFGLGATIAIAILFIVLRAPDGQTASDLSGMAQSVGFLIAALGPFAAGFLRDISGGWTLPAVFYLCIATLAVIAGWRAGRNAYVLAPSR